MEVHPAGGKYWRWKYRYGGKERRLAIGVYPRVSLAQARSVHEAARGELAAGKDPAAEKPLAKQTKVPRVVSTFEQVARAWHAHWSPAKSPRHAEYVMRRLSVEVFPSLGNRPISGVTTAELLALVRGIEARGAQELARRIMQTCGQVYEYAMTLPAPSGSGAMVDSNPARAVRPGAALKPRVKGHFARVEASELPELIKAIYAYDGSPFTRFSLQLMLLTFVRTSELVGARWSEFDLDKAEWRIPAARMKMKTQHIVPLSTQALQVLEFLERHKRPSGLVFPGERDHEKPMSNGTILMALARMGYRGRMTGHGFRGLASTVLHEAGFDHDIIEIQLAHERRDKVSAAYNWATHLAKRREMMQWWADHLQDKRLPVRKRRKRVQAP